MAVTGNFDKRIRKFGLIWIVLAPFVFLMAVISTVRSEITYNIQLAVFSAVAAVAVILGVAALLRRSWSAVGLLVLSWLAAAYFFGAATLVLLWPFLPWSSVRTDVASLSLVLMLGLLIAPTGIPFLLMARALGRLIESFRAESPKDA